MEMYVSTATAGDCVEEKMGKSPLMIAGVVGGVLVLVLLVASAGIVASVAGGYQSSLASRRNSSSAGTTGNGSGSSGPSSGPSSFSHGSAHPGTLTGCCWRYECDPTTGAPKVTQTLPGQTAAQCPVLPGSQTFVAGGSCSATPPYAAMVCPVPGSSHGSSAHPGTLTGCCWRYDCDPTTGAPKVTQTIPGQTAEQCPVLPGSQTFVPGGSCSSTPPLQSMVCPVPGPPHGGSSSIGGSWSIESGPTWSGGYSPQPTTPYDGVDLMIRLTRALREAFPAERGFLISHAPQTPYLVLSQHLADGDSFSETAGYLTPRDYCWGSYMAILAAVGPQIDFLNVQAYNNVAVSGCPNAALLLNNLVTSPVYPTPLPSYFGSVTMAPLKPSQVLLGQQLPAAGGDSGPQHNPIPASNPRCGGVLNPGIGLMFWLQNNHDDSGQSSDDLANASVDLWYPPAQVMAQGLLSPPNRVVYYTNGCSAYNVPTSGYSRCNTIIIGFIYPAWSKGLPTTDSGAVYGLPDWADFGFYSSCGQAPDFIRFYGSMTPAALVAWRQVEPGRRKIMVGVGGAWGTPPYQIWSQGDNVRTVARGLQVFMDLFKKVNGFGLDGIDVDYEDSDALAYSMSVTR